ncbi:MAG: hypothetical protein AAF479_02710 [Pseudomonadota bacterium]
MKTADPDWQADRLILHIGAPRTGTSAIQMTLQANRRALAANGFLYPLSLDRVFIAAMASAWPPDIQQRRIGISGPTAINRLRRKTAAALQREVNEVRPHTLILSAEQLFDRLDTWRVRRRLQRWLAPFAKRIEIIVYLRRQDQAIWSRHLNAVRLGRQEAWVTPDRASPLYDYERRLRPWLSRFGQEAVTVRPYRRDAFPQNSVQHDFMEFAGIDPAWLRNPERQNNHSLDSVRAEFLRRITDHVGHGDDPNNFRHDMNWVIDRVEGNWSPSRLPRREAEAILDLYASANERLTRVWGQGVAFFDAEPDAADIEPDPLGIDDVMHIAAQLWNVKAGQVRHLRNQVERLKKP